MLTELCQNLRNWFAKEIVIGEFSIENGRLSGDIDLLKNQYYRIVGSVFNDGVHQYGVDVLIDEPIFEGAVWYMTVPPEVVRLANDIDEWLKKYGGVDSVAMSPFNSESFGGYSYSKSGSGSSSGSASGSAGADWKNVFASRMNQWRKI